MALSQSTLADELDAALDAVAGGVAAPAALAGAYAAYFGGARLNGAAPVGSSVTVAEGAMAGAMAFDSQTGTPASGAAVILAGVTAFWGSVAGAAATIWPGATTVTPPAALSGLVAGLVAAFATNIAGATRPEAAATLASAIHTASQGATGVIPPTTYPIL